MQDKDEAELIARSLANDHEAYAELIDRYKNALYHHCFAIVHREDAAEDITQETFIAAYYKLRLYKPAYRFSTWLFKIATNKALDYLKQAAKEVSADDELISRIASSLPDPEADASRQELLEAVGRLRPKYRTIISLHYFRGMDYAQIGRVLGASSGSIKGWMYRAKSDLRKELL